MSKNINKSSFFVNKLYIPEEMDERKQVSLYQRNFKNCVPKSVWIDIKPGEKTVASSRFEKSTIQNPVETCIYDINF